VGRTLNYLIGNLKSARQWRNMYVFGASITTFIKMLLIVGGVYKGLFITNNPTVIEGAIVEIFNSFIPIIALFLLEPVNAILTFVSTMFFGLAIASLSYEKGMRRRY